ncbi:UbiA family prenyltransferase [Arcticibacter sp. MXS-1]|uniref:UbiA family prenyltransferase n=1 Tax=Arcticibacter sp. MXS-1 TaxID=3341726 RepID=UPI0035A8BD9F
MTYQLLRIKPDQHVLALLFCSTLALYNFSMLLSRPKEPKKSPFRRVRWIFGHYRLTVTLTIIAIISLIPLTLFLSVSSLVLLFFLGVISVAYNLPLFSMNEKRFGLRNIPGLKLFLIATIWSLSCVLLPIVETAARHEITISAADTILLVGKRFLFIAAITVPFDIRDLFEDRNHHLKTIPVMLGERKAYLFCQILLLAYIALLLLFTKVPDANFWGLSLTIVLTGWLIFKSAAKKTEYYYFFYLDGMMILQYLCVLALNLIL